MNTVNGTVRVSGKRIPAIMYLDTGIVQYTTPRGNAVYVSGGSAARKRVIFHTWIQD